MLARPDLIQGAEIIDITAARGMGDNINAAKAEYINRRREIWAARVPAAVKIIALAILEHMSSEKLECTASKARLAFMCNMPPKTFDRHYNAAKALFHYHERRGKTTIFSPRMLDVAKELAQLWAPDQQARSDPNRYKPSPKMRGGQNEPSPKTTLPQNGNTPPQNGGEPPPQIGGPKSQLRDKLEEERAQPRATPPGVIPKCWQSGKAQMDAGMNAEEALAQKQVWLAESGVVRISDSFWEELAKDFPMVDPASALAAAAPNFRPDRGAVYCRSNVLRQFGYMQQDALRRQANADAYRKAKPNSGNFKEKSLLSNDEPPRKLRPRCEVEK